jgi:hypothetical protein
MIITTPYPKYWLEITLVSKGDPNTPKTPKKGVGKCLKSMQLKIKMFPR